MGKISIKKDYLDGQVLRGNELNINNEVIELGVNDNFDRIEDLRQQKADSSDVKTSLDNKVDNSTFNEAIANLQVVKANKTDLNTKANVSDLDVKADKATVSEQLSAKADLSYTIEQLGYKANKTDVNDALNKKFDKSLAGDLSQLNTDDKSNLVNAINSVNKQNIPIATETTVGVVKVDGTTTTVDEDGTIHAVGGGGGGGGTTDYAALSNKPKINNVELSGNKSLDELNIAAKDTTEQSLTSKADKENTYTKQQVEELIATEGLKKADKNYVDNALETKANITDVYDRTTIDSKIDSVNEDVNTQLTLKANVTDVYNKQETNELINEKATGKADQTYVDTQLALKADKEDTYTKQQIDQKVDDIQAMSGDTYPIGTIAPYGGNDIPANWLLCNGQEVSRVVYSELFSKIGTLWGEGNGTTTFNVPNMSGHVPIGLDADDTNFDTVGKKYGEKTHKLTVDELASHKHRNESYAVGSDADGYHNWQDNLPSGAGSTYRATANSNATGGDQPHNNIQPSATFNYIIKAKNSVGLVGNVTNVSSTSTQDTYSCDYVNKALIKNYATFRLNSNIYSGDNPIKFDIISNISDNSIFELQSDGKIKINKKCTLEINASIRYGYSNPATKNTNLYLNDTLLLKGSMQNATATTIGLTPILIDVNANDLLYVIASSSESCALIQECTYLTIKEV